MGLTACNATQTVPTATLEGAIVPTRVPSETPTATFTPSPTATATATNTPTPSATPTATESPTATLTPTQTPTVDAARVESLLSNGRRFYQLGQLDLAQQALDAVLELDPDNVAALVGSGAIQIDREQFTEALALLDQAIEIDPDNEDALFNLAYLKAEQGENEEALSILQTIEDRNLRSPRAQVLRGNLLYDAGRYLMAIQAYSAAIDSPQPPPEAFLRRAQAHQALRQYRQAYNDILEYLDRIETPDEEALVLRNELQAELGIARVPTATPTPTLEPTTATSAASPTPVSDDDGTVRQTFTGTINNTDYERIFTFEATAGDRVDIRMEAQNGDLDSLIILADADGESLAQNDDSETPLGSPRDSFLQGFVIPADGTYQIIATRFQQQLGTSTGTFIVTLEQTSGEPPEQAQTSRDTISFGETKEGRIDRQTFAYEYTFEAEAGQAITVMMNRVIGDLDPYLLLLNSDGEIIVENDDVNANNRNAALMNVEILDSGTYTIRATRFQQETGTTRGTFEVTLERAGRDA